MYGIVLHFIVLYCSELDCIVWYGTVWYGMYVGRCVCMDVCMHRHTHVRTPV